MDLDSEVWVKHALLEYDRRRCITQVLSIDAENAVAQGDNYLSRLFRVKAKVVTGTGELEERAVIFKSMPLHPLFRKFTKRTRVFAVEAELYKNILPKMEKILKNSNVIDNLWPKLYGVRGKDEAYIMEDISVDGYKMSPRRSGLDFEHCSLVLDSVAKYHAASVILLEEGELIPSEFGTFFLTDPTMAADLRKNILTLANVIEKKWKGEWAEYPERLRRFVENVTEKVAATFKADSEGNFKVLCHGDLWINNLFFKYNKDDRPAKVKFIDFQLGYVGNPALDLQYFITTSLRTSDFQRKTELLEQYQRSFKNYLSLLGSSTEPPTMAQLEEYCTDKDVYSFCVSITMRPMVLLPSEYSINVEKCCAEGLIGDDFPSTCGYQYEGEEYVTSLKYFLKSAKLKGII